MTKSTLQEFFDEFDKGRDKNLPSRLVGITNYLFELGKTSSVTLKRASFIDNPLGGFGFSEIDNLYDSREDIYIIFKKMIYALVKRIKLEKERNPFVLFDVNTVRDFLEVALIYFGSNRNISDLERRLWIICKELLSFLVLGKSRSIPNIADESSIIRLNDFNEKIDEIFKRLQSISCVGLIALAFIFICIERIKDLDDESQFAEDAMAEEQNVEHYIEKKLTELLKQKLMEAFPDPEPEPPVEEIQEPEK